MDGFSNWAEGREREEGELFWIFSVARRIRTRKTNVVQACDG